MKQSIIMKILSVICLVVGFTLAVTIFGIHTKNMVVTTEDKFYTAPSITAEMENFAVGEELFIVQIVNFIKPTAVKMAKDVILEGDSAVKYKLSQGEFYEIYDGQMQKANLPCILQVITTKEQEVHLSVPKSAVLPVNEGQWLQVKQVHGDKTAWLCNKSKWY